MPHDTTLPASAAPTTEAGRWVSLLLAEADIRWPDEHTRIAASVIDGWLAGIEAQARADALDWGRLAYVLGLIGPVDLDDTEDAFVAYTEYIREHYQRDDLEGDPQYADYAARLATATQSSDDTGEEK